jgi:hypothetical protein
MRIRKVPFRSGKPLACTGFCQHEPAFATPILIACCGTKGDFSRTPEHFDGIAIFTQVGECRLRVKHMRSTWMILVAAPHGATEMARQLERILIVGLPAIVTAVLLGWLLLPKLAETKPDLALNAAVIATPDDLTEQDATGSPPSQLVSMPDAAELNRLSLSRQSFRRGGLGSRALMTFTVRNANDYPVKDLEIACAFRSRDGRYVTERRRTIAETISTKSRKAFPMTLMGFVNIKAEKAKCALVTASRA